MRARAGLIAPLFAAACAGLSLVAAPAASAAEGAMTPAQRHWAESGIARLRQRAFTVEVVDAAGQPLPGATLGVTPLQVDFCLGSAFNEWVVPGNPDFAETDPARFKEWFDRHFNCGTPSSTLHWGLMQSAPGEDGIGVWYADNAIDFLARDGRMVLGHGVGWENPDVMPDWVKAAKVDALLALWQDRIEHLMGRYADRINHWVGVNEMLDYRFLSDKLDRNDFSMRAWVYQQMRAFAPEAKLLVNEAGVLAEPGRVDDYIALVRDLQAKGAPIDIIGLQAHFWQRDQSEIDFDVIRARLDRLATLGLPIWITEFDFGHPEETVRANQLEGFLSTALAHPAVEAIIQWGFWEGAHWRADWGYPVALVDRDWQTNLVGQRYGQLLQDWRGPLSASTDADGRWQGRLLHGRYRLSARVDGRTIEQKLELSAGDGPHAVRLVLPD